ncbi:MAG: hypothetical protein QOD72_477 [Acidimicrobiaceae bacterium]|jgi:uncharacterized YccA/Bax inhibitor family protein|nr:hypothetical protein [Acidimicrobiaceae bacterium]
MANPVLSDKAFKQQVAADDSRAGWAAPETAAPTVWNAPVTDGPITPYRTGVMTIGGTVSATAVLFALLLVTAVWGWTITKTDSVNPSFPGWILLPVFAGLGLAILTVFKPHLSRITAPLYALAEGFFVGAISKVYNGVWNGIVVQAAGATIAVFAVMLALYSLRIIRVTERFRKVVIGATLGVAVMYLGSMLFSLFGHTPSFINQPSALGIIVSVVVSGIAAFNLALDFDIIERGSAAGAPKYMEWYGAFGLLVTVVWLYLELLRLLSKLRSR